MNALVIGGSGQIGGWLLRHLSERGHEAVGTYSSVAYPGLVPLIASDTGAVARLLDEHRPDVVFYPAGFTWVDGCERDPARSHAVNVEQPLIVGRAAADRGARFLFFSTDYVFDGLSGPYTEEDVPNPVNTYGRHKLESERAMAEALGDAQLTMRTCWVYGPERQGKNFAYSALKTLRAGKDLVCPSDMVSSPSYGPDVALAAVQLAEMGTPGLIHLVGPEIVGRVDFARDIAGAFGVDVAKIVPRPNAEIPADCARPLNGGLLTPRIDALLPGVLRPLGAALADFRVQVASGEWSDPVMTHQAS